MTKLFRLLTMVVILVVVVSACTANTPTPAVPNLLEPPSLTLTITANPANYDQTGQQIIYTYTIKNSSTGNLGPAQFTLSDNLVGTIDCGDANTILVPNDTVTCTATYTISQADMNVASLTNNATASGGGVGPSPSASVTITKNAVPTLLLTLTTAANPTTYSQVGQQITYTYVIQNSGSSTLGPTQFTVSDKQIGSAPINCGDTNKTLAPNELLSCTATYAITQADLDVSSLTNNATASGGGAGPSQSASVTISRVVAPSNPANLEPGKTIPHRVAAGEWLMQIARCYGANYLSVRVANPQLANPSRIAPNTTVNVPDIGSAGRIYGPPCVGTHTVQSGDTWNSIAQLYNADLAVLQKANAGVLSGKLIVPCNSAGGPAVACNAAGSVPLPQPVTKTLTLTTTADPSTYDQVGQSITYTYVIKNSGNTTLGPAQFTISDGRIGSAPINCGEANKTLAPNESLTCTATYTISQADMNVASLTNNATASGGGAGPSQSASATISKNITMLLTVTTAANPTTYSQAGQQIVYTYVIQNSGSTTIGPAQFSINDGLIGAGLFNCGDANKTLAPNELLSCTATYTITQVDLDVSSLTNNATASGGGAGPSQPASTTINKQ